MILENAHNDVNLFQVSDASKGDNAEPKGEKIELSAEQGVSIFNTMSMT